MRGDILENKELVLELISNNKPKAEICRLFKCRAQTLDVYLKKMGIEYDGNQGLKGKVSSNRKPALYHTENATNISSHKLKKALIRDNIKEHKCESCKMSKWMGYKIPIELHHIDGNRFNNKLDNLQIF